MLSKDIFCNNTVLALAPMVEISHMPFRKLVSDFGDCDLFYTEMTSAAGFLANSPFDKWFLDCSPCPQNTIVQFMGSDLPSLVKATEKIITERNNFDQELAGIDFNFGCAAPHIEKTGGGVKWMKTPDLAAQIFSEIRKNFPHIMLSAKMRLGYEMSEEALLSFCKGLELAGADYIVIHPRLKSEKFRRQGHWEMVNILTKNLSIPVIGNGDIKSPYNANKAINTYGIKGVMIGREAVRRPWIFKLIRNKEKNPDYKINIDIEETGLKMLELIKENLPSNFHISRARRFFFYYCSNLKFDHGVRYAIQNSNSLDDIKEIFSSYFRRMPEEKFKIDS